MKRPSFLSRLIIRLSNIFSSVFAPLFVPTYGMIIALTVTPLRGLPVGTRILSTLVVMAATALIPLAVLVIMKRTGKITDIDVSDRRQRAAPVAMMLICYAFTVAYLYFVKAPGWLVAYFWSGIVTALVFGLITMVGRWKISMHGAGMGNAIGFIAALWVGYISDRPLLWLLTAAILIAGIVGTSRVILNRHTLGQVFAGIFLSMLITYIFVV